MSLVLHIHEGNGLKYGMLMYLDHFQKLLNYSKVTSEETISYLLWCINASKGTPQCDSQTSLSWPLIHMITIQELLLDGFYKFPSPPRNFLGTHLDIKGLHYGIVCHPILKMPRVLIVSSASIRSGSSYDHMSGTLNVCMISKLVTVPI